MTTDWDQGTVHVGYMEMTWDMFVVVENGWRCDDDDDYCYDYDDNDCCCVMRMVKRGWAEEEGNYETSWMGVEERDSSLSSVRRAKGMVEGWYRKDCRDNSSRHSSVGIILAVLDKSTHLQILSRSGLRTIFYILCVS